MISGGRSKANSLCHDVQPGGADGHWAKPLLGDNLHSMVACVCVVGACVCVCMRACFAPKKSMRAARLESFFKPAVVAQSGATASAEAEADKVCTNPWDPG